VITAVRAVRAGMAAIEVDGAPWLTVSREAATALGLRRGINADPELARRLEAFDARRRAYEAALLLLSYRPRSEAELRSRLAQRGIEQDVGDEANGRVRAAGLLDDAAFARAWVSDRASSRGRGRRALAAELRAKGVASDTVDETLSGIDEDARALSVARERAARLGDLPWPEFQRRLGGFLTRRGFGYGAAGAAVRTVWRERDEDASDTT
jgi:regulatory protein